MLAALQTLALQSGCTNPPALGPKPVLDNLATGCQLTIQKFDAQQLLSSAIKTSATGQFQKLGLLPGLFEAVRYS